LSPATAWVALPGEEHPRKAGGGTRPLAVDSAIEALYPPELARS
jgi:hypothetical protein